MQDAAQLFSPTDQICASAFERDGGIGLATNWCASGVALKISSHEKHLSKIEPDARCIVAPTDEECFPGIAIKFRAQQTLRDGMHQVRLIAELHVVKQSTRNVNESLGRRGDGNRR